MELRTISLFRCTEKIYAEQFCKTGNMKFNTPKYWVELEKKEGKGRGDILEGVYAASNIFDIPTLTTCAFLRENSYGETIDNTTYFRSKDVMNLPCYCFFGLNNSLFSNPTIDEKGYTRYPFYLTKQYFEDFSGKITKED